MPLGPFKWHNSCSGQVTPEIREQIASVQAAGAVALARNPLENHES